MKNRTITTSNDDHRRASTRLNEDTYCQKIARPHSPVARFVGSEDVPFPPAPAWYVPQTRDIYIHADEAGIDTGRLITNGLYCGELNSDKAWGLLAHETAHASISEDLVAAERKAPQHNALLTMFEEVRVENFALRRSPTVRRALRASFTLVLEGIRELDVGQKATIARAWGLVHGRTLAGVATLKETKPLDDAARVLLGETVVDQLNELLQEVATLSLPDQTDRLLEICDEWVDLVGKETGESDDGCAGEPDGTGAKGSKPDDEDADEDGDKRDGGGRDDGPDDGGDYDTGTPDSIPDIDDPDTADADPEGDLGDAARELTDAALKELSEKFAEHYDDAEPEEDDRSNALAEGARVFGNRRRSARLTEQEPTIKNRQDVLEVSKVLSNLALPAVSKVSQANVVPPGRLRSREAVRASAERAQGQMTTATPWRGSKRRHSVAKPLIVGVATDTSGSMRWAQKAVADFAYVYANAGHRIGARTAAVTFGDNVLAIAKPGEVMSHVLEKEANDGTEECDRALAALDGVLHLTTPSFYAARILVIVSDACLVKSGEQRKVTKWLTEMVQAGTTVIWVGSSAAGWSSGWVHDLTKRATIKRAMGKLICVDPDHESTPGRAFDALNEAVLSAIKAELAA